jgi:predicted nucleic acid-binding protein
MESSHIEKQRVENKIPRRITRNFNERSEMISFDTNILLYSIIPESPHFQKANLFMKDISQRTDIIVSEFVLMELYSALRNQAILNQPLTSYESVQIIKEYRNHPYWLVVGFPDSSKSIHDLIWEYMEKNPKISRTRIFDLRLAYSLQAFGVKEFVTMNLKDFNGLGFSKLRSI